MKNLFHLLKRSDYAFLVIISLVYGVLIWQYIPVVDDQYYAFGNWMCSEKYHINSLYDAIVSQCHDYMVWSGRFLIHTIVQYCCGVPWGRELFFIISILMFLGLISGMMIFIRRLYPNQTFDKWIILAIVLFLMPTVGVILFGRIAFVANYLWTSALSIWLIIIWLYINEHEQHSLSANLMLFAFSFVTGCLQEGFSIPICGAMLLYYGKNYRKIRGSVVWLLGGFAMGTAICVFAPANFVRASTEVHLATGEGYTGLLRLLKKFVGLSKSIFLWELVAFHLIVLAFLKWKGLRMYIKENQILYLIIAVSLLFAVIVTYHGDNQLMIACLSFYLLIILFVCEQLMSLMKTVKTGLAVAVGIAAICISCMAYFYRTQLCGAWQCLEESAYNRDKEYVDGSKIYEMRSTYANNYVFNRWVDIVAPMLHVSMSGMNDITSLYLTEGHDAQLIDCVLPDSKHSIRNMCREENMCEECVYVNTSGQYYILRIPSSMGLDHVKCVVEKRRGLYEQLSSFIKAKISYPDKSFRVVKPISSLQHFEYGGFTYAILYDWDLDSVTIE